MNRREFVKLGSTAGVAAIALPQVAFSGGYKGQHHHGAPAGGIYYTTTTPGRWSKKVKPHLPVIEVADNRIQVVTNHPMAAHGHYITKHVLLDSNFEYLTEKVFDPINEKKAMSTFNVDNYSGKLYVVSHCNLHDSWLNSVEI